MWLKVLVGKQVVTSLFAGQRGIGTQSYISKNRQFKCAYNPGSAYTEGSASMETVCCIRREVGKLI